MEAEWENTGLNVVVAIPWLPIHGGYGIGLWATLEEYSHRRNYTQPFFSPRFNMYGEVQK